MANDGTLIADDESVLGVSGRDNGLCCTSFVLGVSGCGLLDGTIKRLKLLTLSRNESAGEDGACGRGGRG